MRKFIMAALIVAGAGLAPQPALAWGEQGHSAVCELAYRNFTPNARTALTDLYKAWSEKQGKKWQETPNADLLYTRFMNSCMFEDVVKNRKELSKFADQPGHFVNYPRTRWTIPDREEACSRAADGTEDDCIYRVLDRDLGRFRNAALPKADRAEALIGIGHWLGDIHQPLHISFADDKGGGKILIEGICGRSGDLHGVWDTCLLMKGLWEPLRGKLGMKPVSNKRTIAFRLVDDWRSREDSPAVKTEVAGWVRKTDPWQWAQESYAITLAGPASGLTSNRYCFRATGVCTYAEGQERFDKKKAQRRVAIDQAYLSAYSPVVEQRLRQAGYRLAWIVNNTLDPGWNKVLPTCSNSAGTCPAG